MMYMYIEDTSARPQVNENHTFFPLPHKKRGQLSNEDTFLGPSLKRLHHTSCTCIYTNSTCSKDMLLIHVHQKLQKATPLLASD